MRSPVAKDDFLDGMRRAATGVTIVTTKGRDGIEGATVSAMVPVSADVASLLVCVYYESRTAKAILANRCFAVSLLRDSQWMVADDFAGRTGKSPAARFADWEWDAAVTGSPMLRDALVGFDCRLTESVVQGTHSIFIGEVAAIRVADGCPLVYSNQNYCRAMALSP
ncbi:flavin reductase family protein [Oceanibacterium hippocampi]|uniref:NADH:FAD oxidoreductase n=1 Tax=Oceanibacterium hippocampi TaxID=745714 RepID=A0A1Y5THJ9_9PROT|nr:flavin reductase family protein [Oceanibacterium hippocampi]SLN64447.1 NADH:FAD oxidoreductase [Oceanibacterium hippocampi]